MPRPATSPHASLRWRSRIVLTLGGACRRAARPPRRPPAVDATALAKEQQNPISSMATIPWQMNFNSGGGLEDGTFFLLNVQPVIPFKVSDGWNMIVRTIVPIVSMPGPGARPGYSGIGDIQEQVYLTPSKGGKFIWGAGPVVSMPTATAAPLQNGQLGRGSDVRRAHDARALGHRRGREQRLDLLRRRLRHEGEPVPAPAVRQLQLREGVGPLDRPGHHGQLGCGERAEVDGADRRRHQPHRRVLGPADDARRSTTTTTSCTRTRRPRTRCGSWS